ncbi:MAG: A/G-specific adenine glycosylase [Patescibacteria group bacterium]|jgi:A/G-specific adenine glycosylase
MVLAKKLLTWYRKEGRRLPWRGTRNPYRILVSEIMLAQTQVPRVLLFYSGWMKKFPNWKSLASASNAQVLRAWAGLGYNRRALMLRDIARDIVKRGVPQTEEDWGSLKGIGRYTAAALTVFSLRQIAAPIDTNIRRVIGRAILGLSFPSTADDEKIRKALMREMKASEGFADIPQALFDLATIYCQKEPACALCSLRNECKSAKRFLSGRVRIPSRMTKKTHERIAKNKHYPDRIYRGRILAYVRDHGRVSFEKLGPLIDEGYRPSDASWLRAMVSRLEADGMVDCTKTTVQLTKK